MTLNVDLYHSKVKRKIWQCTDAERVASFMKVGLYFSRNHNKRKEEQTNEPTNQSTNQLG